MPSQNCDGCGVAMHPLDGLSTIVDREPARICGDCHFSDTVPASERVRIRRRARTSEGVETGRRPVWARLEEDIFDLPLSLSQAALQEIQAIEDAKLEQAIEAERGRSTPYHTSVTWITFGKTSWPAVSSGSKSMPRE